MKRHGIGGLGLFVLGILSARLVGAQPLSLLGDRFHVEASWRTAAGATGTGTPVSLTDETGYFWFFSPTNTEVVVKVLDACSGPSSRFWVFAGGLTDTEVTLTVTDEANGVKKVYHNPLGTPFAPIQDTAAFATCAVAHCGQGSFADLQASPRAHPDLEAFAAVLSGTVAAPQAVYDRVVADVASIGAQNPDLRNVTFQPGYMLQTLNLDLDSAAAAATLGGTYTAWDCLNRRYGVQHVEEAPPGNRATLYFTKVLNLRRLIEDYKKLPGVLAAGPEFGPPFPIPVPVMIPNTYCGRSEGNLTKYYVRSGGSISFYTSLPGAAPILVGVKTGTASVPWQADMEACFSGLDIP